MGKASARSPGSAIGVAMALGPFPSLSTEAELYYITIVSAITRRAAEVVCASCARTNLLILPELACGNEFIWYARCGKCGTWRWFHSREDEAFVRAIRDTARRRGEMGGLSAEGTREAHAVFEARVDACPCGGRFHAVRDLRDEPCLGCGGKLGAAPGAPGHPVQVSSLR